MDASMIATTAMLCGDCGSAVPMHLMVAAIVAQDELWDECAACGGQLLTAAEFEDDVYDDDGDIDEDGGQWI